MNILLILSHPDKNSFNHAIAKTAQERLIMNGHSVILRDLHAEKFDPILPLVEFPKNGLVDETVQQHCKELTECDGIIVVHPNWWGQPPGMLKGWVDRVIRPGIAYEFEEGDDGEGIPIGLLKAKAALVFNTSNTSAERENNLFGDPLESIWKNCIFDFCGIKQFYRKMFRIIVTSKPEQRKKWLTEVNQIVDSYFPKC